MGGELELVADPFLGTDPSRALWRCAVLDPPWQESGGGGRGAQNHYPLLDVKRIRNVLLASGKWRPHGDSHLWCWYTDNFLEDALWLVKELGFRYVRQFHWVKVAGLPTALDFETGVAAERPSGELELGPLGIGQYGRGAHESMLFCVRGRGQHPSVYNAARRDVPSVILAPTPVGPDGRRIHSRKPDASYELVEARSLGPHMEFFARRDWPGWLSWGNESPTR